MVQKRPSEEFDDFSLKQPRHSESGDHAISNLDTLGENVTQMHHDLVSEDESLPAKITHQCNGRVNNCHKDETELLTSSFTDKEIETGAPVSLSNSSWTTSTTSDEDNGSDAPFRIFLPPEYYNSDDPVSIIVHQRDLYYSLLEFSPQKLIPLGSEFQAEIPEFGAETSLRTIGTCVIPMPETDVDGNEEKPGNGRTDCSCEDIGSIRCFKQHIEEARLKLKMTIDTETFCKLGLDEMGEVVAEKWSEKEIEMYHDVIFSNPASLGMNFWDHLATAFPLRKKEIVSFYFNVFILRKRAEQNRYNVSNIDSDNDELEANDISDDEVVEKINEDDDVISELQGARIHNEVKDSETTSDDMIDHSISNPSARLVLFDENCAHDVQNVQNGTFNTCVDGEPQDHGCQNGVSSWMSSKDNNEPDLQGFPENEDFLLPTRNVMELFGDCDRHMKNKHG